MSPPPPTFHLPSFISPRSVYDLEPDNHHHLRHHIQSERRSFAAPWHRAPSNHPGARKSRNTTTATPTPSTAQLAALWIPVDSPTTLPASLASVLKSCATTSPLPRLPHLRRRLDRKLATTSHEPGVKDLRTHLRAHRAFSVGFELVSRSGNRRQPLPLGRIPPTYIASAPPNDAVGSSPYILTTG